MENYKTRLQEQAKALQTDIDLMVNKIKILEDESEVIKGQKSQAQRELRSIEKKLAKL